MSDKITKSDIDVLRHLDVGWEKVWHRVVERLLGDRLDGPLAIAAHRVCRLSNHCHRQRHSSDDSASQDHSSRCGHSWKSPSATRDSSGQDRLDQYDGPDDERIERPFQTDRNNKDCHYIVSPMELISFVYEYYDKRLKEKSLLTAFDANVTDDPESGLFSFLCSASYLKGLWAAAMREIYPKGFDAGKGENEAYLHYSDTINDGRFIEESENFETLREKMANLFSHLRPSCSEPFSAVALHAGLQLYPRLDPESENNIRLQAGVCDMIVGLSSLSPEERVRREHQTVQSTMTKKLERLRERLLDGYRHPRRQQKGLNALVVKIDEMMFESIFLPMETESVVQLTGAQKNTVYQNRRRYRLKIPEFFPDLHEYYSRLKTLRQERGETVLRWGDVTEKNNE